MENPEEEVAVGTRRINIQYNGSELYDSFELRQMTHQLNKAMQASSSSPAYQEMMMKFHMNKGNLIQGSNFRLNNSPMYRHRMNRIYKENAKTPRRISGQKVADKGGRGKRGTRVKGFVARLWMKVKQGLLGNYQETNPSNN